MMIDVLDDRHARQQLSPPRLQPEKSDSTKQRGRKSNENVRRIHAAGYAVRHPINRKACAYRRNSDRDCNQNNEPVRATPRREYTRQERFGLPVSHTYQC